MVFNENPIPYGLRKGTKIFLPPVKSFRLDLNSVHFRASILWNNLTSSIKNSETINEKQNQRIWKIFTVHVVYVVETFFMFFKFLELF